jgi:type IV pilus assembly protein PilB
VRKKIGECLIQAGLITDDDLRIALEEHKRTGERVGVVLVRMNLATEKQIAKALAFQLGFPYVNLAENPPDPSAVILIPKRSRSSACASPSVWRRTS